MVSRGEGTPHKLSRAPSWVSCSKDVCKRSGESAHPSPHGQCFSSELHQQTRGDPLVCSKQPGPRFMDMVPSQPRQPHCTTYPRGSQYSSRLGIEGLSGLKRLKTQSAGFCGPQQTLGSPKDRPVCKPLDQATSQSCELETGPRGLGNRCIHPRLEPMEGVCLSPFFVDRSLLQASPSTTGCGIGDCNTSLASTSMVPFTSGTMHRHSSSTSQDPSLLMRDQDVHPMGHLHLAGWLVSMDHSKRRKFLQRLGKSFCQPGAPILPSLMHQPGTSGIGGVWNTTMIPFHHLFHQS